MVVFYLGWGKPADIVCCLQLKLLLPRHRVPRCLTSASLLFAFTHPSHPAFHPNFGKMLHNKNYVFMSEFSDIFCLGQKSFIFYFSLSSPTLVVTVQYWKTQEYSQCTWLGFYQTVHPFICYIISIYQVYLNRKKTWYREGY